MPKKRSNEETSTAPPTTTKNAEERGNAVGSRGGKARAEKLTPEQRKEIATKGALSRWRNGPVIKATHAGSFHIGPTELACANLPDGRRVLAEATVMDALGRGYSGYYSQRDAGSEEGPMHRALSPQYLRPFIPDDLKELLAKPIWYLPPPKSGERKAPGNPSKGVEADALVGVCEVWLKARDAGALKGVAGAEKTAGLADMLMRGLARVGIASLIDEATGAQEERNKQALQAILDRFLVKELAEWAKRFPDTFYEEIFRLRKWPWRGRSVNPPQVVAHYTKDLVYSRLAPGLMQEMHDLASKEPRNHKLHQWLSKEGQEALKAHFNKLNALMQAADTWEQMKAMVDKVLPKQPALPPYLKAETGEVDD